MEDFLENILSVRPARPQNQDVILRNDNRTRTFENGLTTVAAIAIPAFAALMHAKQSADNAKQHEFQMERLQKQHEHELRLEQARREFSNQQAQSEMRQRASEEARISRFSNLWGNSDSDVTKGSINRSRNPLEIAIWCFYGAVVLMGLFWINYYIWSSFFQVTYVERY